MCVAYVIVVPKMTYKMSSRTLTEEFNKLRCNISTGIVTFCSLLFERYLYSCAVFCGYFIRLSLAVDEVETLPNMCPKAASTASYVFWVTFSVLYYVIDSFSLLTC